MEYLNAMYCKKSFVNSDKYKEFHYPEWHTNLFDVEAMKYVCKLKYEQNKGFRELLAKTKGKMQRCRIQTNLCLNGAVKT
jgi:hypothetical protein